MIWRQQPKVEGPNHFGSRLVFRADGTLFVTLGDRYAQRERAQDLSTTIGKIVRINADGSVPRDNPFVGRAGALPEIWSLRPPQRPGGGARRRGELWTVEHGARGGDELNNPQPGKNYGWPVITYGVDYSGARIGEGTAKAGMEQPVYYWDPVIAPSGATFYTGAASPTGRATCWSARSPRAASCACGSRTAAWRGRSATWRRSARASATCGRARTARSTC